MYFQLLFLKTKIQKNERRFYQSSSQIQSEITGERIYKGELSKLTLFVRTTHSFLSDLIKTALYIYGDLSRPQIGNLTIELSWLLSRCEKNSVEKKLSGRLKKMQL